MRNVAFYLVSTLLLAAPCSAQTPSPNPPKRRVGDGLKATYFRDLAFRQPAAKGVDRSINFMFGQGRTEPPGIAIHRFSARWTGQLLAPVTGRYVFSSIVDEGVRIWVGGVKVLDEWGERRKKIFSQPVLLRAGTFYEIRMEYFNNGGNGYVDIDWDMPNKARFSAPGFATTRTIIPTAYLFSDDVIPPKQNTPLPTPPTPPKLAAKPATKPPVKPVPKPPTPAPVIAKKPASKPATTAPADRLPVPKPTAPTPAPEWAPGETFTLRQVQFEQSSYILRPESRAELDRLADALRAHPAWRLEIAGHTDNVGDPRLNVALSENRAKVVANYLIRQGIADDRVVFRGYGGTRPVADNAVESERSKNRRVEITIR